MLKQFSVPGTPVSLATWKLAEFEIACQVLFIKKEDLPLDWLKRPYPESTRNFGTAWAEQQLGFCVAIPSIRIPLFRFPEEHNLLLNPLHSDFQKEFEVIGTEEIRFAVNSPSPPTPEGEL